MHFLPGQGQQDLFGKKAVAQNEKAFKHNEEIALHKEQELAKQNMTTRQKKFFKTPHQS